MKIYRSFFWSNTEKWHVPTMWKIPFLELMRRSQSKGGHGKIFERQKTPNLNHRSHCLSSEKLAKAHLDDTTISVADIFREAAKMRGTINMFLHQQIVEGNRI